MAENGSGRSPERTGLSSVSLFYRERTGKNFDYGSNLGGLIEFDPDSPLQNSKLQANSLLSS